MVAQGERLRRRRLVVQLVFSILLLLGLLGWAGYIYYRAATKALETLEPLLSAQLTTFGDGPFWQRCLLDLQADCSSLLWAEVWQQGNPFYLYGAAASLGFITWTIRGFKPAPLYTSDWGTLAQLSDLVLRVSSALRAPIRRALLIVTMRRKLLGISPTKIRPELGHMLICGPTRSGKSLHLMSNLLNWSGSAVVIDIKGELHRITSGHRARFTDVAVLDPSGVGARYDPFADLGTSAEALQTAAEVALQIDRDTEPVFAQRGSNALFAARRAAHLAGEPTLPYLYEVTRWGLWSFIETLREVDDEQVSASLVRFVGRDVRGLKEAAIEEDRFLNSAWSTITSKLTPLLTEGVRKMTSGFDVAARQLFERPTTLYLRFAEAELDSTKHVLRLTVLALITSLLRYADTHAHLKPLPVLLGLDEAGRVHIPRLDDLVSTVAGRGVSALVYVQDLAQFDATYSAANAKTIRSNCHTQLFYPPKDLETARYISAYAGMQSRTVRTMSKEHGLFEERRFTYSETKRELITPDEVRRLSPETVVVFAGNKPPFKAKRLSWLKTRWLRRLTRHPATKVEPIVTPNLSGPVTKRAGEARGDTHNSDEDGFVQA